MSKLLDMFTGARRTQSGGGMGFLGKPKSEIKPRAAALIVALPTFDAGSAESAIKAGADSLLFTWNGEDTSEFDAMKDAIEAAKAGGENVICGLQISGGWEQMDHEKIEHLKEQGVNFIILPLDAPARLLAIRSKDVDLVVTVPMREGELYPTFIRNLVAFDSITAVRFDFELPDEMEAMSIEDLLHYRAVREAVRYPGMLNVSANLNEKDAFTIASLGIQALILPASSTDEATAQRIQAVRTLLEKVRSDEKEASSASKS
ncbi:MAG TPA: hypothetical protein VFQ30_09995 [Ktedonobacteraceae bacterium]|nr:hypothetical protein [Ktedonobacteraceae bacterium]